MTVDTILVEMNDRNVGINVEIIKKLTVSYT